MVIFKEWRYNIPLDPARARKLGLAMPLFWQRALELVDVEPGVMQETVTLLAGEGGLLRIAELLEQDYGELSNKQLARMYDAQILPFLRIITHQAVISSAVLETRVMTIYNYVYGPGGARAVQFFQAIARHISRLVQDVADTEQATTDILEASFESCLAALSKLIEVNTIAQVNQGLLPIVEMLANLLENSLLGDLTTTAKKYLNRMQQRLGLGEALPTVTNRSQIRPGRASFALAGELPGELSEEGPRHDNDKLDINEISILPTLQEIQSSRLEYLPLADSREWHLDGLQGLLDRNFRLLREDTIGQLRDATKFEIEKLQNPHLQKDDKKGNRIRARHYVYDNVALADIAFDPFNGLEFALAFDQPKHLLVPKVQLLSSWCRPNPPPRVKSKAEEDEETKIQLHAAYKLWSDSTKAHIVARLVNPDEVTQMLDQLTRSDAQLSIAEFPGVLLPAFMPTLQAMQRMSRSLDVPFANILAQSSFTAADRQIELPPPAYGSRPRFQFDLSTICNDQTHLEFALKDDVDTKANEFHNHSSLDPAQAHALVSSLARSVALIQGPPGTGKSYTGVQLIRALLANKTVAQLGPLLCVTFTNHALDQSLERLIEEDVLQIVRIGGGSKSERLADINLRAVAMKLEPTKTEKRDRWELRKQVEEEAREINSILAQISEQSSPKMVQEHLQKHHPERYKQLFGGVDDDGFTFVNYHENATLKNWLESGRRWHAAARPSATLEDIHVNFLRGAERRVLYQSWLDEIGSMLQDKLLIALDNYKEQRAKLDLVRTEVDLRVLRQANIIGMTTSGLARNLDLLRRVGLKVVVCEEAGEILEAHQLTALLPSVEQVILVGDQQQLRPHIQNHNLSCESKTGEKYALDISLFERLVQPNNVLSDPLPFCTLEVQRRMHPMISQLVRKTQYPQLQDGSNVSSYAEVSGMRNRMFWMHHEHPEDVGRDAQSTSHTNDYEVEMAAALVSHLVKQGIYRSNDIAVITPYLGQLRMIRKKLSGSFEIILNDRDTEDMAKAIDDDGEPPRLPLPISRANVARGTLLQALRIATVDNFQGAEAKVIVVSLVRSNKRNEPGFLRTPNRINVLLSRAQHACIFSAM